MVTQYDGDDYGETYDVTGGAGWQHKARIPFSAALMPLQRKPKIIRQEIKGYLSIPVVVRSKVEASSKATVVTKSALIVKTTANVIRWCDRALIATMHDVECNVITMRDIVEIALRGKENETS